MRALRGRAAWWPPPAIDTLLTLGTEATCGWIADDFDLEYGGAGGAGAYGWKTLEITWLTNQGSRLWIDAIDWLFLSLALVCVHRSVALTPSGPAKAFSVRWATLGLVIAFFAFFDFVAECARFAAAWRAFSAMSGVLSVLNTLILLPAWLVWLSTMLPAARHQAFASLAAT